MLTLLAGGVGAARFLEGLAAIKPAPEITVIANTGDDATFYGLHVSPDIDTLIYTMAGLADPERGWGIHGDTLHCLSALKRLGAETWFQLGDCDLATHLYRAERLRQGATLSKITQELCEQLGVRCRILPMSDDPAPTRLRTAAGEISFQEYFVKLRQEPEITAVDLSAAARATAASGVIESILQADAVIVAPSNPILSIGPILAVPRVREALRNTAAPVAAVSPIVGGKALKGPAARNLVSLGWPASAVSVARLYRDFLDLLVLDEQDSALQTEMEDCGVRVITAPTIMSSLDAKRNLASVVLSTIEGGLKQGARNRSVRR